MRKFKRCSSIRAGLMAGCAAVALAGVAQADEAVATAPEAAVAEVTVIGHAMRISPSNAPLEALQPTSSVPAGFIRNNIIPLASLDDIVKFQPSVWAQNPNGPGIGKAETLSLRGFQDGQYNITFDGIPFGDATDLHHTTSALFIAHDLGEAQIDRGPGTASTIGKATFGGAIGFVSKAPDPERGLEAYGTVGSFNTRAGGVELDSGRTDFGSGYLDFQHEETDGYLTHSNERRTNYAAKFDFQFGDKTTLTLLGSYNHEFQYTTQGATLAQYAKYGDNYGLCDDPSLQCYYKYQPSNYYSDFEYARLKTEVAGVRIDEMVYTNAFAHVYTESKDASEDNPANNGVTFYDANGKKVATFAHDIPGKATDAAFRAWGNTLRLAADTPIGEVRAGVWYDRQDDHRISYSNDLSQGGIPVLGKNGSPLSYDIGSVGTTWQPYVELAWKPLPELTVVPGVKYTSYKRDVDAAFNKNTKQPLDASQTFSAVQPSIAANYAIRSNWTAYAQVAKGFLAPPIDVFEVNDVVGLKPEETVNYQIGASARTDRWMLAADVYYIDFDNFLSQTQAPGTTDTTFVNGGGAIYKGVELEAQYALGHGFSLYGNYSANSAKYKNTDVWIAGTPKWTAAVGLLYDNLAGPYFSVIGKMVGPHFGEDNTTDDSGATVFANDQRIGEVFTADLAGGWRFQHMSGPLKDFTASIKIGNLFNSHKISDFAGNQSVSGDPLYWRVPGRSVFFNIDTKVF